MSQSRTIGWILSIPTFGFPSAIAAFGVPSAALIEPPIGREEEAMSILAWIVLGLASGYIGGLLANSRRKGLSPDILLGLAGAMLGGWLFHSYGPPAVNGLNLGSYLAAFACSVVVLLIYYAVRQIEREKSQN
jgi:uncharacterized membrane protein YeaQ/YmgE (transglycosylase-associated protein family)